MTTLHAQPAAGVLSGACGLAMAAVAGAGSLGPALSASALAGVVVAAGVVFRPAATLAVLLAASAIVLSDPPPAQAAAAGLCATAYLVLRHSTGEAVPVTAPTMVAALGFTVAGVAAAGLSWRVPWLPLLAPLAVLAAFVLALRPFLRARGW
ncbi:hypothetical protein [Mycobacterium sp.]|uniref:hypothetical protein n=1 Tax=Mycobacterium sp. TaxID=1785 RepID=UPI0031D5970F